MQIILFILLNFRSVLSVRIERAYLYLIELIDFDSTNTNRYLHVDIGFGYNVLELHKQQRLISALA